jgi:hypothetical protein
MAEIESIKRPNDILVGITLETYIEDSEAWHVNVVEAMDYAFKNYTNLNDIKTFYTSLISAIVNSMTEVYSEEERESEVQTMVRNLITKYIKNSKDRIKTYFWTQALNIEIK